ncbi:hypothetical protein GGS23DRAFT_419325 [Durotheca rogersii]|uniref:uncharacterized protein n=1 Tax=Durotheca rogersii TaxID=419775 RepID=UPI00221E5299|nr:uncharacterized protein GGS23DRAFT_419325 [Durotheca rogersii]KAI5865273.1 hypothetical protein GGS23DRAFT_419325 [Durotheca rogersii]
MTDDPYLGHTITAFEGGITTHVITHPSHPDRVFAYEVTFLLQHPRVVAVASRKPPLHLHPHQEEYIEVLEGRLVVEVEGKESTLLPEDGEFTVLPWTNHRLYSPVSDRKSEGADPDTKVTRFILSGERTPEPLRLDTVFFENWYAYQDQVVLKGMKIDLIQVMSMFDAGGSYLSLPPWIPFGRTIAQVLGIVIGRWIGGILGYQPFYREWTTDWESACRKMEVSVFQRRFANRSKSLPP